jgi:DNA-binding MarR family transcriptional regulator
VQAPDQVRDELLIAIFGVLRQLKRISGGQRVDGPTLGVLHQMSCLGPARLSDIATEVGLDISTVSRHVRALEDVGYVTRATDPADRRASRLELTDEGRTAMSDAFAGRSAALHAATATWTDDDRRTLAALLERLADDLAQPSPETS